jgi:hypothetical protein
VRRRRLVTIVIGLLGGSVAASAAPAPAAASTSVAIYSDARPNHAGDSVLDGLRAVWTPANSRIRAFRWQQEGVAFHVGSRTGPDHFDLIFTPAPGRRLRRGVFEAFNEDASAGIDVSGNGSACDGKRGRFEIKDIARNRRGEVARIWIVYEYTCRGGNTGIWGEVRLNERATATAPSVVRWSPAEHGEPGSAVPVTVFGRPGRVAVIGRNRRDFRIVHNGCRRARRSCRVRLRFTPHAAGTRRALLAVGGARTPLEGFAFGGRTDAHLALDPGGEFGDGGSWSFTPRDSILGAGLDGPRVTVFAVHPGIVGDLSFGRADGKQLTAGTYNDGGQRGEISASIANETCGTQESKFTVSDLKLDRYGNLHSFAASFQYDCHESGHAHGEVHFRVGDRARLPPWMRRRR